MSPQQIEVKTFGKEKDTRTRHRIANLEDALAVIERFERDGLTDVYRREVFCEKVQEMLGVAQEEHTSVAYMQIDLDHFKITNDTYGHPVGDAVLKHAVQTIKESIRTTSSYPNYEQRHGSIDGVEDIVGTTAKETEETVEIGRVGGEEFGVALYGVAAEQAYAIAERIRAKVASTPFITKDNKQIDITISIGIETTATATTLEELYDGADQALYHAKHNGRNRTELSSRSPAKASPHDRADKAIVGSAHLHPSYASAS